MKHPRSLIRGLIGVSLLASALLAHDLTDRQLTNLEKRLDLAAENSQSQVAELTAPASSGWQLRSKHLCFGLPRLVDGRHNFDPDGKGVRTGVTVLVREGFVVAHFDRMRAPLFVSQRWTAVDYHRMEKEPVQDRRWSEDREVPSYARGGTSYDGATTQMDLGHMARHEANRAWGVDSSDAGCKMSNSAPQHKDVNRGTAWRTLEDSIRDVVNDPNSGIETVWVISGTLYRGKDEQGAATPEDDFQQTPTITTGFGVPKATYKVVGWFDKQGGFHARGYVFEQTDRGKDLKNYMKPIDEIERRAGVDFFPELTNTIEDPIEAKGYESMWGSN